MGASEPVRFYFDFVSPYSYLALTQAEPFAREHSIEWDLRPVVYGVLLDVTGLVGPVEVKAKRKYTFRDLLRSAQLLEVPLVGPLRHPFRSLEALRTICLFREHDRALDLAFELSRVCWGEGRPLTDIAVIEEVVAFFGLDAADLDQRIADPSIKQMLKDLTKEALDNGVFGVPTFIHEGELFWGHDRLPHLAARLRGDLEGAGEGVDEMLRRPRGADRQRVRGGEIDSASGPER